jgi:membrane-associated protease RseP (regulator of RpoE activity)
MGDSDKRAHFVADAGGGDPLQKIYEERRELLRQVGDHGFSSMSDKADGSGLSLKEKLEIVKIGLYALMTIALFFISFELGALGKDLYSIKVVADKAVSEISRSADAIDSADTSIRGAVTGINGIESTLSDIHEASKGTWVDAKEHGWLGLTVMDGVAKSDDDEIGGVVIVDVVPDSPADRAGLKKEDLIVKIDDKNTENVKGFKDILNETAPGDVVKLTIIRDGYMEDDTIDVTLTDAVGAHE